MNAVISMGLENPDKEQPRLADPAGCRLSIVAPVFTDETVTVRLARDVLSSSAEEAVGGNFEILFADDGSAQCARDTIKALSREDPRIRLIGDGVHHGLGAMVRWGIKEALGEYILYTDGDGEIPCRELAQIWPERDQYDLFVGFRTNRESHWYRRFGTYLLSWVAIPFFGVRFRDVDCSFKFARADFLKRMSLRCKGTGIDAEILLRATRGRGNIRQVPVSHRLSSDRKSKVTLGRILYGISEFLAAFCRK